MRIPGNFDRWMFNYKEGNLSAEEAAYFESFMLSNPDFAEDAEAWDNAYVRKEPVAYHNMNALLKEKSPFAMWRNWAAILILLLTVGGGIGVASNILKGKKGNYEARTGNNSKVSIATYQSLQNTQNKLSDTDSFKAQSNNISTAVDFNGPQNSNSNNRQSLKPLALFANNTNVAERSKNGYNIMEAADNGQSIYQHHAGWRNSSKSKGQKSISHQKNRKIDSDKITGSSGDYAGSYRANPSFDDRVVDADFKKSSLSLLEFRVKRFLSKLDKVTGYPIALVNLRDPDLLVPNKNLLNFNPGFAGSTGNFRMGADYRNQWAGSGVNSQLSTLYFDTYSVGARGGIGGSIQYGQYQNGVYQNMTANLYYSPKFALGKHVVFEPAIKVTMGRDARNIDNGFNETAIEFDRGRVFEQAQFTNAVRNDSWYKDYGVGFVLNTDWFYVGGFIDNLAGHDERIFGSLFDAAAESPQLITGVIGFDYQSRNKRTTLSPFLTYYQNGTKKEAWAGATAQINWLTLGASYSSNNEYEASVGLKFKAFRLTYQMDMTESEFMQENFVSHNIGIRFSTPYKTIR